MADLARVTSERDQALVEVNRIGSERDRAFADRDHAQLERDQAFGDRDRAQSDFQSEVDRSSQLGTDRSGHGPSGSQELHLSQNRAGDLERACDQVMDLRDLAEGDLAEIAEVLTDLSGKFWSTRTPGPSSAAAAPHTLTLSIASPQNLSGRLASADSRSRNLWSARRD
ncbi:hypothetical protein V7S43_004896 [Phytophthora oleae]|uniref:Uncharacterized protein n=1 Tax=Phytophthora oleae TaxID=2107226 RepID=A0ABD3FS34_9STRA